MGWGEFVAHLRAAKRQDEAREVTPDSWKNAEHDAWWANARRERAEKQRR